MHHHHVHPFWVIAILFAILAVAFLAYAIWEARDDRKREQQRHEQEQNNA